MTRGHQWIHFDAQFPLGFGHDLQDRFGAAGELLFILFLCAAKRSYPQGQVRYRSEEEFRIMIGAHFDFVDNAGDKWTLDQYWKWCGARKVTRTKTLNTRKYVTATRWDTWEDDRNSKSAERMRRSRAETVRERSRLRGEVGGVRLEDGGWRGEGRVRGAGEPAAGQPAENPLTDHLEKIKTRADQAAHRNGTQP